MRARGQLMSDYPSVDDMTDEVLARAYRHPDLLQNRAEVLPKLHRILMDVAKEEAAHDRTRRRMLSLEAPPRRETHGYRNRRDPL
jgi:DNA-directed RNA polymerase specialized sigma24 family protein